jgi:hypothetical protein
MVANMVIFVGAAVLIAGLIVSVVDNLPEFRGRS